MFLPALLGLVLVTVAWFSYLSKIASERVPRVPLGTMLGLGAGSLLSIIAVFSPPEGKSTPLLFWLMAMFSVGMSFFFFWLLRQASVPKGVNAAAGQPLLHFQATDHEGEAFDSASLRGKRVLLKLFRGQW